MDWYWVPLQDWSTCNKKCGGWTRALHRACVPPRGKWRPCEWDELLIKKCNPQPCPNVTEQWPAKKKEESLPPIVKVMSFSSRYQRYTKCIIKEWDALWVKPLKSSNQNSKQKELLVPVRIIMNNKSVAILQWSEYEAQVYTFRIKNTKFYESISRKNCWWLKEETPTRLDQPMDMVFCPFWSSIPQ